MSPVRLEITIIIRTVADGVHVAHHPRRIVVDVVEIYQADPLTPGTKKALYQFRLPKLDRPDVEIPDLIYDVIVILDDEFGEKHPPLIAWRDAVGDIIGLHQDRGFLKIPEVHGIHGQRVNGQIIVIPLDTPALDGDRHLFNVVADEGMILAS